MTKARKRLTDVMVGTQTLIWERDGWLGVRQGLLRSKWQLEPRAGMTSPRGLQELRNHSHA